MIKEENYGIYRKLIFVLSIAIPLLVALLLGIRIKFDFGVWTKVLPHVIGVVNTITACLLILGLIFIKNKQFKYHENAMTASFISGSLFLLLYVLYHLTNQSTPFGGQGSIVRFTYYFLLISHIILSIAVVPLVLRALFYGLTNQVDLHRKIVKFAFPIWLYVSITGVIVYLMISPYYI